MLYYFIIIFRKVTKTITAINGRMAILEADDAHVLRFALSIKIYLKYVNVKLIRRKKLYCATILPTSL